MIELKSQTIEILGLEDGNKLKLLYTVKYKKNKEIIKLTAIRYSYLMSFILRNSIFNVEFRDKNRKLPSLYKLVTFTINGEIRKYVRDKYRKETNILAGYISLYNSKYKEITLKHMKYISKLNIDAVHSIDSHIDGKFEFKDVIDNTYKIKRENIVRKIKNDKIYIDIKKVKQPINEEYRRSITIGRIKTLIETIKKAPKYPQVFKVWRGVRGMKNYDVGDIVNNPIPLSTSLLPIVANSFAGEMCCLFEINVPKNFPCLFINNKYNLLEYNDFVEYEVIIHPCKFRIKNILVLQNDELKEYLGKGTIKFFDWIKVKKVMKIYIVEIEKGELEYGNDYIKII